MNELKTLITERDSATGTRRGVLTKRIKQIESKLQETGAIPASQVKVMKQHQGGTVRPTRKTGKFDKQLIIEKAATATDAEHLAKASTSSTGTYDGASAGSSSTTRSSTPNSSA